MILIGVFYCLTYCVILWLQGSRMGAETMVVVKNDDSGIGIVHRVVVGVVEQ